MIFLTCLYQSIMWGGTALSLCFLSFRIFVRLRYFKRIYVDDILVLAAWMMLLASSVIWQTQQTHLYNQFMLSAGQIEPTAATLAAVQSLMRANLAVIILLLSCLWSVKVSVLVFFRRLGQPVRGQNIWWWFVTVFTIISWVTCIGVLQYRCLLGSAQYILSELTRNIWRHDIDPLKLNVHTRTNKSLRKTLSIIRPPRMLSPIP